MLIVTAFCPKDYAATVNLYEWIAELDPVHVGHSVLLVAAKSCSVKQIEAVKVAAQKSFESVTAVQAVTFDERGWPMSCNTLFKTAARYIEKLGVPFWWNESDCIPLRSGWIDELEAEYKACKKPFMGHITDMPLKHLTGCAIYPPNIADYNLSVMGADKKAWDVVSPLATLRHTHHTKLFHHEWGDFKKNIPRPFRTLKSLDIISPEACVFHRSKSGDLIERLRDRRKGKSEARVFVERILT
jgi:hypothetical protein